MDNISIIFNILADFKSFALLIITFTILLALWYTRQIKKFNLEGGKKIVGLFFRLSKLDVLKVAVSYITMIYIVDLCINYSQYKLHNWYMFVFLASLRVMISLNERNAMIIGLNRLLQGIALVLIDFILNYVQNIRYDEQFIMAYWVGTAIVLLYSFYVFIGEVYQVSKGRKL